MIVPKVTIFFVIYGLYGLFTSSVCGTSYLSGLIPNFILFSATMSIIIGSIGLINQWNIIRFLAYSGVSHTGWILIALYTNATSVYTSYIVIYILTSLNILLILITLNSLTTQKGWGTPIALISDLRGLSHNHPLLSLCLAISLLSLAG